MKVLVLPLFAMLLTSTRVQTGPAPGSNCHKVQSGKATHYGIGDGFAGKATASGEIYRIDRMTAAHRELPLGSQILVTAGDRSVAVRVNDRGPALWTKKDLDLTPMAFSKLGDLDQGVLNVEIALCRN